MGGDSFSITIAMKPVALARARMGRGFVYTPSHVRLAKQEIATQCKKAMAGREKFSGPVSLVVIFSFYKTKKTKPHLEYFPAKKPDLDNLVKLLKDSLNNVVWLDDSQVVDMIASKRYGPSEGLQIEIKNAEI